MPSPELSKPADTSTVMLTPTQIHDFGAALLERLGFPTDDANHLASAWTWAARRGKPTHSIIRVLQVANALRTDHLRTTNDWSPVQETATTTLIDARDAYGVIAGSRGMHIAIEKARKYGCAVTTVRDCDNTGALGMYPAIAVAEGMIGMAITSGMPIMGAWGGAKPIMGNQAFSIGAPAGTNSPLLLDMHLAAGSLATVRERAAAGKPLPPGIAADVNGEATTDGKAAAAAGIMLPMAGYGGYGLGVMWEMLTGVLSGGRILDEHSSQPAPGESARLSLFLMAIDPRGFIPQEEFTAGVDRLIDRLHALPTAPGVDRVRVPGDTGSEFSNSYPDGLPVSTADLERIRPLADKLGVPTPG
jgi:LDH2 family malate/lactate/ureidoglycolate dehydrogenase